ncbi:MAG: ABC transporter substrate-binding protein [Legionellales bacterium]|nr:ABC transporter substrate-binding protein [Legionellales bacterium]
MESRVNYTIVGFFVILALAAAFVIAVWLSVGLGQKDYDYFLVYSNESVSGLSVKSPVKYNGVNVGFVESIGLRKKHPEEVKLVLAVEKDVPVSLDTRAILNTQGLTGIGYMELKGGKPDSPKIPLLKGEKYPIIKTSPSLMFRLDQALDKLTSNVSDISQGLERILSQENAEHLTESLENIQSITDNLQKNNERFDQILADTQTTMDNTATASKKLPALMTSIDKTAQSFQDLSHKLSTASTKLDSTMTNVDVAVKTVNDQLLPPAVNAVSDFGAVMLNLKGVSQQLDENPSVLIRGREPLPPGPGER